MTRYRISMIFVVILLLIITVIDLFHGYWDQIFQQDFSSFQLIFEKIRLPRIIAAILSGIALSISGMQMQSVFRNPLAGPYVLGISSGASLGVALMTMGISAFGFSFSSYSVFSSVVIAATIGSLVFLLIVFSIYLRLKQPVSVLIAGVLLGSAVSSIVNILQYFSSEKELKSFIIWTMGNISSVTWNQLWIFIPWVGLGLILSFFLNNALNILRAGDDYAKVLGLRTHITRPLIFITTGMLTGAVMAFCGPIAFVGVAVPHIARITFNTSNHRHLFWACILTGALIMVFSDFISSNLIDNIQIPINSITSLIGIPVVLWVLFKGKKIHF